MPRRRSRGIVMFNGEPYVNFALMPRPEDAATIVPVSGSGRARAHIRRIGSFARHGPSILRTRELTPSELERAHTFDMMVMWNSFEKPQSWGRTPEERRTRQANYVTLRNEMQRRGLYRPNLTD